MSRVILKIELAIDRESGAVTVLTRTWSPEGDTKEARRADVANVLDTLAAAHDATVPIAQNSVAAPTQQQAHVLGKLLALGLGEAYIADQLKVHSIDRLNKLAQWVLQVKGTQGVSNTASLFMSTLAKSAGKQSPR